MSTVIETHSILKEYILGAMNICVLHGIDLSINEGEYVALMGPSGSGKSTLMNILGCLDSPTGGQYYLDGIEVSNYNDNQLAQIRSEKIGFVFQSFNLLSRESALENVTLPMFYKRDKHPMSYKKHREFNREKKASAVLHSVGLGDRMHHKPNELSGGERQRVAIARSLVNDPRIILADEPTGNLDSKSGGQILQIFHDLSKEGKTIIMVTHDPNVAKQAQRTIHLKDGLIEKTTRSRKIKNSKGP